MLSLFRQYLPFLRLQSLEQAERVVALALSGGVLVGTTFIGFSILLFGRPVAIFVLPATLIILGAVLTVDFKSPKEHSAETKSNCLLSLMVLALAAFVGTYLSGHVIPYSSLWGDIGVYVGEAEFLRNGGETPFSWKTNIFDAATGNPLPPPLGIINPYDGGLSQFHGLPTWPGVIGMFNSSELPFASLYAISIWLFFRCAKRLLTKSRAAIIISIVMALLPLLWHQTIYSTSELFLFTIFLTTAYLILFEQRQWPLISVGVLAFGLVHTSFFITLVFVGLVLFLIYYASDYETYQQMLPLSICLGLAGLLSFAYAIHTSEIYTKNIINGLFGEHSSIVILCCLAPVVGVLGGRIKSPGLVAQGAKQIHDTLIGKFGTSGRCFVFLALLVFIFQAWLLGWTDYLVPEHHDIYSSWSARVTYANRGVDSLWHLSIVNVAWASAILGLVGFVSFPFLRVRESYLIPLWWFTAGHLVVFTFIRPDIPNNFYASRYFLPVLVPCLLIFGGVLIDACKSISIAGVVSVIFVGSVYLDLLLVRAEYFSTDELLTRFIDDNTQASRVWFSGSDWLKYHLYARGVARMAKEGALEGAQEGRLIGDSGFIFGDRTCLKFDERRIPWQITYISRPEIINREVCAYGPIRGADTIEFERNFWLVDGKLDFLIFKSQGADRMKVIFEGDGWWNENQHRFDRPKSLQPRLIVCGTPFELVFYDARKIIFEGMTNDAVCEGRLATETFKPSDLGGADGRALGFDIRRMSVYLDKAD